MTLPKVNRIRQADTHRFVPSKYCVDDNSVLARLSASDELLQAIFDLDCATNERLLAENRLLPGIGTDELVFGVPYYRTVNAAFTHAHPLGSRFNGPDRGAWYASFEAETSQAEVAWHKTIEFAEINWFQESITYDDYLADFGGDFHDIRDDDRFSDCLDSESYVTSQGLAEAVLASDGQGIIYPSVRRPGGTCLVCFRPALVGYVRRHMRYRFTWDGKPTPYIEIDCAY